MQSALSRLSLSAPAALAAAVLAAAVLAGRAPAQPPQNPCGPGVIPITWRDHNGVARTSPAAMPELGAAAFGVPEVGQIWLMPNPGFGTDRYYGAATLRDPVNGDWDPKTFTWNGPGTKPTLNNHADRVDGPGDEFQISVKRDGRVAVMDTGPTHPVGIGNAVIMSRPSPTVQFVDPSSAPAGRLAPIKGVDMGYIDPQLGVLASMDVLFWVDSVGNIRVGEIDTAPYFSASIPNANFGGITNSRIAVPFDPVAYPGMQTWHSPTPLFDDLTGSIGETRALVCGNLLGSGSDGYFVSTPDRSRFLVANITPDRLGVGGSWAGNPAVLHGTSIWASSAATRYVDPRRVDFFAVSSTTVPSAGGMARTCIFTPLGAPPDLLVMINYGFRFGPFDPRPVFLGIGFPGTTNFCINPFASTALVAPTNNLLCVDLPVPPVPAGRRLPLQCIGYSQSQAQVWLGNLAWIEIVP